MSWNFLGNYLNSVQTRQENMKAKLSEANCIQKELESLASLKAKNDAEKTAASLLDQEAKLERDAEQKKVTASLDFERPQAMAQVAAFEEASKEYFLLAPLFENSTANQTKTLRLNMKMTVNKKVGQLTDSIVQIKSITADLVQLYFQTRSTSKEATAYFLILLSSKIMVLNITVNVLSMF